jgi:Glucosidase II beta subunit-like protein
MVLPRYNWNVILVLLSAGFCHSSQEHKLLFPPNDEYDHKILDPNSVYGSPYGGFGRATRSRLANLPLVLPVKLDEPQYFEVTDGQGRPFVCRTYSEDEIEDDSMKDSVFDRAIMKPTKATMTVESEAIISSSSSNELSKSDRLLNNKKRIESYIELLTGICTQYHNGWWSYEWCFEGNIKQFHLDIDDTSLPVVAKMTSMTKLGDFRHRTIESDEETRERLESQTALDKHDTAVEQMMTPLLGKQKAMGIIIDHHINGEECGKIGNRRSTKVEYRCCSPDEMQKLKPFVLLNGIPILSDIVGIVSIEEPTTCHYHILICTPLLCDGLADFYDSGPINLGTTTKPPKNNQLAPANLRPKMPDESIRDILDRTLENICLIQDNPNHWWTYELCHGMHARQYHQELIVHSTGFATKQLQSEYLLGKYDDDKLEGFDRDDEIKFVVNVTEFETLATTVPNNKKSNRGNGAYFYQEYTDGQICDNNDPDVKDKAGTHRSVTVRFFCGDTYALVSVEEDATCHYVMDVTLPDLCEHPLFKKPVEKKQVIKCFPDDSL